MSCGDGELPRLERERWNGRLVLARYEIFSLRRRLGIIVGGNGPSVVRFVDRTAKCYGEPVTVWLNEDAFALNGLADTMLRDEGATSQRLYYSGERVLVFEPENVNVTLRTIYGEIQREPHPVRVLVETEGYERLKRVAEYVETSKVERLVELETRIRADGVGFRGCRYDEWNYEGPRALSDRSVWHSYLTDTETRELERLARMPRCCYQIRICKRPNYSCLSCGSWYERKAWIKAGLTPPATLDHLIRSQSSRRAILQEYVGVTETESDKIAKHSSSCFACEEFIESAAMYRERFREQDQLGISPMYLSYSSHCPIQRAAFRHAI